MDLYLRRGDVESAARVAGLVTYRMLWWTRVEEIVDTARSVLDVLPEEPSRARIRLLANLGAALNVLDEPGSLESIERAIGDARALGDESAPIYPTLTLGLWHLSRGHATESLRVLADVLELTERSNDESWRSQALAFRLPNLPSVGRLDDALSAADEAEALGRERGDVGAELQAHLARIVVGAMKTGDGVELEALGRDFMERFHQAGPWRNYGLTLAGLGTFWQGDLDEALVLFDRAVEVLQDRTFSGWPRGWRFMLAAYAGRFDARSLYRALEPELFRPGGRSRPGNLTALHAAIQGLVILGDLEAAASHYPGAEESLGFGTVADFAALWQCSTGVAAACAEEWDAAEEHFATALRQADEIPYLMAGFDTRRWYAWALLRRGASGNHERARVLLEEAIAGYRKLSARFLEQVATELLEEVAG
jgi:tetratricopeptide (TPR) repeat protein